MTDDDSGLFSFVVAHLDPIDVETTLGHKYDDTENDDDFRFRVYLVQPGLTHHAVTIAAAQAHEIRSAPFCITLRKRKALGVAVAP
mgnify:CR=1 FL=1